MAKPITRARLLQERKAKKSRKAAKRSESGRGRWSAPAGILSLFYGLITYVPFSFQKQNANRMIQIRVWAWPLTVLQAYGVSNSSHRRYHTQEAADEAYADALHKDLVFICPDPTLAHALEILM